MANSRSSRAPATARGGLEAATAYLVVVAGALAFAPGLANPFLGPKAIAIGIAAALFAGVSLASPTRAHAISAERPLLTLGLLASLVVSAATIGSLDPLVSLLGSHGRLWGLFAQTTAMLCVLGGALLARRGRSRAIRRATTALATIFGALAVAQALSFDIVARVAGRGPFGLVRAAGTFETASFFGSFLVLVGAMAVATAIARPTPARMAAATLSLAGLFLTFTRGAWLGFAVAGVVFAALAAPTGVARRRWLAAAALVALLTATFAFAAVERSATAAGRLETWANAAVLVAERPLLGWGPDTFAQSLALRTTDRYERRMNELTGQPARASVTDRAHNLLFDVANDGGLVGLALFLWLVVYLVATGARAALRARGRERRVELSGLVAALAGYLASLLFHFLTLEAAAAFFFLAGYGAASDAPPAAPARRAPWLARAALALLCVSGLATAALGLSAAASGSCLETAEARLRFDEPARVAEAYERAARLAPFDADVRTEECFVLARLGRQLGDAALCRTAIAAGRRATALAPRDVRGWFWLGGAYLTAYEVGGDRKDLAHAVDTYERARAMNDNYADLHLQLGAAYFYAGDLERAVAHWKRCAALAPRSTDPLRNLVVAYRKLGDEERARDIERKIAKTR